MSLNGRAALFVGVSVLLVLAACSAQVRKPPPPDAYTDLSIFGQKYLRAWGDDVVEIDRVLLDDVKKRYEKRGDAQAVFLAISGGGSHGAYGAGVLAGWTDSGNRPEFMFVTGISTGALIAPFAFLGPEYDELLRTLYTTTSTPDIVRRRYLRGLFGGDSLLDSSPLRHLIETYVTDDVIRRIAEQSRLGRVLVIGTTNMDAGRPVLWNITRIAELGRPEGAQLIRDVILASASIPGAFPPVYIQLDHANGNRYDEMHVDGGISNQIFLFPPEFPLQDVLDEIPVHEAPRAYLIFNDFVRPRYEPIKSSLIPITVRAIDSLLRSQGNGDLFRINSAAAADGIQVKLTWLPDEALAIENEELFDPAFMRSVYELGYERARSGDAWSNAGEPPPGGGSD